MISLTRRYRFPASHRLHSPHLSDEQNQRVYGKCNNPFGHGHDYVLDLTISGPLDPATGLLLPIPKLDEFVAAKILRLFAYRNINLNVPQFAHIVPTTENMIRVIADLVVENWTESFGRGPIRPSRIYLQETGRNSFELLLPIAEIETPAAQRNESVMLHA